MGMNEISIRVKKDYPTTKFNKHWRFCVGSPHASYALRQDWCAQLKTVKEELGIERVRFHGIFCDDMHTLHRLSDVFPIPGGKSIEERSFRFPAVAYDNILSCGMKPFVELSFMPRHLAKRNKEGMFFYKPNISPPKDLEKWGEYIESFVRFLVDRYSAEEVRQWYFEVWNEPDLKLPFFAGTQRDYFNLYKTTANAVKKVDSSIMVGGPSTSGSKWVGEFLDFCRENNVPVDFVTTHQYAGDSLGGIEEKKEKTKINVNPFASLGKNRPATLLGAFRKLMMTDRVYENLKKDNLIKSALNTKKQTGGLPLFYTEWNLCASFSAECNDTRMAASYDVHSILGTGETIDGSSIWCFTDLFEELHPFPEEFHGGFGMMTQSSIKKPLFYAMKYLGELPDDRIVLPETDDDITAAAFKDTEGFYTVLTLPCTDNMKRTETAELLFECDNAPSGVQVLKIDEYHANSLREWKNIGSPQIPSPRQIRDISEKSCPFRENFPYSYENGTVRVRITLNENDIVFVYVNTV